MKKGINRSNTVSELGLQIIELSARAGQGGARAAGSVVGGRVGKERGEEGEKGRNWVEIRRPNGVSLDFKLSGGGYLDKPPRRLRPVASPGVD